MLKSLIEKILFGNLSGYGQRFRSLLWLPFIFCVTQLLLTLLWVYYNPYEDGTRVAIPEYLNIVRYLLFRFLAWGLFWCLLVALPSKRVLRYILAVVAVVLILMPFMYELFMLKMYHVLYNDSLADIMLSTNSREGVEFFKAIMGGTDFLWVLFITGGIVGVTILVGCLLRKYEAHWASYTRLAFIISLICVVYGVVALQLSAMEQYYGGVTISKVRSSSYERFFWETRKSLDNVRNIEQAIHNQAEAFNKLVIESQDSPFNRPVTIVLILGESTSSLFMHGYGYPLRTTPKLDSMEREGQIVRFRDVVSPASSTILSNTRSLTYYTMEDGGKPWYQFPTLLSVMKRAGYKTAWVTAQDAMGMHSMVHLFGSTADTLLGTPGTIPTDAAGYYDLDLPPRHDGQLLDILLHRDQMEGGAGFFEVVHQMGCHEYDGDRFPKEFEYFHPEDLPQRRGEKKDRYLLDYLNAVYYNDFVTVSIIDRYKSEDALVFYFSDHGEVVYNDPSSPDFRGRAFHRVGVSVPFYAYMSPSLRRDYPEVWERLIGAKDLPYETDLFTHTLTGLLGIRTKYTNPSYELFSNSYRKDRPRVVVGLEGSYMPLK